MLFFFKEKNLTIERANFLRPLKDLIYIFGRNQVDRASCQLIKSKRYERKDELHEDCVPKNDMQEYSCQENLPEIGTDKRHGEY